ncbi:MAG TPA: phosphoribosylanthranilate isomerase [Terriglobales bacterium]|nr:phosphoribosylanthranilate isomerase [Terriglobales bacterium]
MVWVKICGMTNPEDARAAAEAGADSIGMLFAPSKRRITVEVAKEITRALPHTMEKVGVFYDESAAAIEEIAAEVGLTAVQLHGDESPDFAQQLFRHGSRRSRGQMRVFKTLHVAPGVEGLARNFLQDRCVDGVLLDSVVHDPVTGKTDRGGTGQTFDWKRVEEFLPGIARETRVIVAGGLSPTNVADAIRMLRPWGVDVCSGVEAEPGKKDLQKLREFVIAARAARN